MAGQTAEIGTAYISILPSTEAIAPGVKKALGGVEKASEQAGQSLGSKLAGGIGKTLKVGAAGVGVAAGGVLATSITKGLGRLTGIENAEAKLAGLGHEAEGVASIMDDALASVKGTAFGLEDAATIAASAVAAGVKPGQDLQRTLKLTGDAATIAGTDLSTMGSIINKVATSDMMQMDVANQLMDAGIPILQMVGEELGVTAEEARKMASAGEISFEIFQSALEEGLGGAALKSGETVQGAFANMGAAAGRFGAKLADPVFQAAPAIFTSLGGVFDEINDAIDPATQKIGGLLTPALENLATLISERVAPFAAGMAEAFGELAVKATEVMVDPANWERIGSIFGTVRDTVERLWPAIQSLAGSFMTISQNISVAVWESLAAVLNALAPVIESVLVPLIDQVAKLAEQNPGAVQAMVIAFLGFKAVGAVAGPVKMFAGTMKNLGGAFKFLTGAFKGGGGVAKGLVNVMGGIGSKNPMIAKMAGIIGKLVGGFGKLWRVLGPVVKVLGTLIRFINPWVAGITIAAGALGLFFRKTETGQKIWEGLVNAFRAGVDWIKNAFAGLRDLITGGDFTGALREAFGWEEDNPMIAGILKVRDLIGGVIDYFKGAYDILFKGEYTGMPFGLDEDSALVGFLFGLRDAVIKTGDVLKTVFSHVSTVIQTTLGVIGAVVLTPLILAWNYLSWSFKHGWENVVMPAWEAMKSAAIGLWENGVRPAFDFIQQGWQFMTSALQIGWAWLKQAVFDAFQFAITALYVTYVQPTLNAIAFAWDVLKNAIGAAWAWVKINVIDAFQNALTVFYTTYVVPILNNISLAWDSLKNSLGQIWAWIKANVIDAFVNALTTFYNAYVVPILNSVQAKWDELKNALHAGWTWIDSNVLGAFRSALDGFKSFFSSVVDGIASVWDSLRGKLAKPINFMINVVYNEGILKAWNTIADMLPGLEPGKRVTPIAGYATGGQVQRDPTGAVRGPGTGTSDSILARIANGEHILTATEVAKAGGHGVIYAMRDLIKHGRPFSFDGRGRLVGLRKDLDLNAGDLAGAAPGLLVPRFAKGGEVRPLWETQLARAHKWASSRHGRPYVFGGSADGGGGTDCSGFMSGIANVIQGGSGARQWATGAFNGGGNRQMDFGPQGFVRGLGKYFSIGVTNGGPGGGHTAGTLGPVGAHPAVNVESGGSPSMVKYGTGAVGADHRQFATQYNLPIGPDGAFVSGGDGFDFLGAVKKWVTDKLTSILDPIKGLLPQGPPAWQDIPRGLYDATVGEFKDFMTEKVSGLGELASGVWGKITDLFDNGGWLMPGRMATNKTGKPEPILTDPQWAVFKSFLKVLPFATENVYSAAREMAIAFEGDDAGYGALADILRDEEWAKAVIESSATLGKLSASVNEWRVEMEPVVRKSAEDYAMEQGSALLSPMGLEGVIPLAQKVGAKVWDAYHAQPVDPANASPTVVEIEATGGDFVHVDDLEAVNDRVDGLEVKVNRKPAAATVTRGGAL